VNFSTYKIIYFTGIPTGFQGEIYKIQRKVNRLLALRLMSQNSYCATLDIREKDD